MRTERSSRTTKCLLATIFAAATSVSSISAQPQMNFSVSPAGWALNVGVNNPGYYVVEEEVIPCLYTPAVVYTAPRHHKHHHPRYYQPYRVVKVKEYGHHHDKKFVKALEKQHRKEMKRHHDNGRHRGHRK